MGRPPKPGAIIEISCQKCAGIFTAYASTKRRFCSRPCAIAMKPHPGYRLAPRKCVNCGGSYHPKRSSRAIHACSARCWRSFLGALNVGDGRRHLHVKIAGKCVSIHRLIAEEAFGVIPEGQFVHHVNGDKLDNRPDNLAFIAPGEHASLHMHEFHAIVRAKIADLRGRDSSLAEDSSPRLLGVAPRGHTDP